jgi:hypothetical protein
MKIIKGDARVYVTLSKRNLEQLLAGISSQAGLVRTCEDGTTLHVLGEEDEAHYQGRQPGPGLEGMLGTAK